MSLKAVIKNSLPATGEMENLKNVKLPIYQGDRGKGVPGLLAGCIRKCSAANAQWSLEEYEIVIYSRLLPSILSEFQAGFLSLF